MNSLLSVSWWFSMFGEAAPWWLAMEVIALLALPLVMRWLRFLPDRGMGVAPALGALLVTYTAWVWAFPKSGAAMALFALAGLALAALGWWMRRRKSVLWPAPLAFALIAFCSCGSWRHAAPAIALAALLWGAVSAALWWGDFARLWKDWRRRWVLWLAIQILFTLGFFLFVNIRSYIPWATYEVGMSGAEKFGNFAHLNSCIRAETMPPPDAWWAGRNINYYYGGHLMTATFAKLTGRPAGVAFNLGLAMIVALTLTSAFSLTFNLVNAVARFARPRRAPWPEVLRRQRVPLWTRGMGWALLGAVAVTFFGNLYSLWEMMGRDLGWVRRKYDQVYAKEITQWREWRAALERARAEKVGLDAAWKEFEGGAMMEKLDPKRFDIEASKKNLRNQRDLNRRLIARLESHPQGRPPAAEISDLRMRLSLANLTQCDDFWRPSRMVEFTVTEFPWFSAILGDHHAHHFALPFNMVALVAVIGLMRKGARLRRRPAGQWLAAAWPELLAMAFLIGALFPINAWDPIVLAPMYLLAILLAMGGLAPGRPWGWVTAAGAFGALGLAGALLLNARPGMKAIMQTPLTLGLPFVFLGLPLLIEAFRPGTLTRRVALSIAGAFALTLIAVALLVNGQPVDPAVPEGPGFGDFSASDALFVLGLVAAVAALWAFWDSRNWRWWGAALTTYGLVGFLSLLVILPFKLYFESPFYNEQRLLVSLLPPRLDAAIFQSADFWGEIWKRSVINPFPANLRTEFSEYLGLWGIFWIPMIALWAASLIRAARRWEPGRGWALAMSLLALVYLTRDLSRYWIASLTLGLAAGALVLAITHRADPRRGPLWVFLTAAMGWSFFLEVLHFDDSMSGENERYNSIFKIYYPLWPLMAAGMVMALRELVTFRAPAPEPGERLWRRESAWVGAAMILLAAKGVFGFGWLALFLMVLLAPAAAFALRAIRPPAGRWSLPCSVAAECAWTRLPLNLSRLGWKAPLLLCAGLLVAPGMIYPIASTATRTNWFHNPAVIPAHQREGPEAEIYTKRTLDASAYLGAKPEHREDLEVIRWIQANVKGQPVVLEWASHEGYKANSRIASNTGLPTILGWEHHELQWRGWTRPVPESLRARYREAFGDELEKRQPDKTRAPGNILLTGLLREHVDRIYRAPTFDAVANLFDFYKIRYVVVGGLERKTYGADQPGFQKFERAPFRKVFESGQTALYEVSGDE